MVVSNVWNKISDLKYFHRGRIAKANIDVRFPTAAFNIVNSYGIKSTVSITHQENKHQSGHKL